MKNFTKLLLPVIAVTGVSSVQADVQFNGFASIKAGMTTGSDETLMGYTDTFSLKPQSLFAIQAQTDLGDGLSATAQIMARGRDNFETKFEWAYISYELSDSTKISAGRLVLPFYKYSQYRDVGYAYHWQSPPDGVYSLPFSTWDGISVYNTHTMGSADGQLLVTVGSFNDPNFVIRGTDFASPLKYSGAGFEYAVSLDSWSARVGTMYAYDMSQAFLPIEGVTKNEVFPVRFRENLSSEEDETVYFTSSSVFYDNGQHFAGFEWTNLEYDEKAFLSNQESSYVTVGTRVDEWTFHATYGWDENEQNTATDHLRGVDLDALTPELRALVVGTAEAMGALGNHEDSTMWTIGVNYSFHPSATLKVDYSTYSNDLGTRQDANAITFGVDLVF